MIHQGWLPFVLACEHVRSARQISAAAAAELLRQVASIYKVRVRYSTKYLLSTEENRKRKSARESFPSMLLGDDGDNGICASIWESPFSFLQEGGPGAMADDRVQNHTEWQAGELEVAFPDEKKSRKGVGGRPPNAFWHVLGVEAGAWMTDEGAPSETQVGQLITFLESRIAQRGFSAEKSQIQEWAKKFLDVYRAYRDEKN